MKFEVMNRENAKEYSYKSHTETSIIISISSACSEGLLFQKNNINGIKAVLPIFFDDVENGEKFAITTKDATQIAKFVKSNKDMVDKIIVHCDAGVSRSAGVCAAIMKYINGNDMPIFNSARFCPNMLCYTKVLTALFEEPISKEEN